MSLSQISTSSTETMVADAAPCAAPFSPTLGKGREAFQSLLGFSALHAQVRIQESGSVAASSQDVEFVLDDVLQLVAERGMAITGADGIAVALAEGEEIICRGSAGEMVPDRGARLNPNSGFSGACFRSGEMIRCDDTENDARVNVEAARRLKARSMIAVPLKGQRHTIGLLEAFSYDAHAFNDSDVRSLNLLAELILSALKPGEEDRHREISLRRDDLPSIAYSPATEASEASNTAPAATAEGGRPGLAVVAAVVLFAVVLGAVLWWKIPHGNATLITAPQRSKSAALASVPKSSVDQADLPAPTEFESDPEQINHDKLSVLPQVTGIRHWSAADASTVVIDLQDQVQYEAHRLTNPDRIYFDLHDTALAPGLSAKTIEIGDGLLTRVRVAQPIVGVTRVVLETNSGSNFSVSLEPNPYRLVLEVRRIGVKTQASGNIDLFAPVKPQDSVQNPVAATPIDPAVPRFRLVLDPGHGGWDLGTVGRKGLLEKDLVLDIASRAGKLVESRLGAEVVFTRRGDNYIALEKRAEVANQARADLFVSVHANYSDFPSARGVETYYTNTFSSLNGHDKNEVEPASLRFAALDIRDKVQQSHRFAASIQQSLYKTLAATNPGLPNRGVKSASYVVLTGTAMPAVLAEVSFVSSPTDENNLQSSEYRQRIAEALYQGIARFAATFRKSAVGRASAKLVGH
jgi:N-acetylmuramoyl-L-alanine amidase